MDRTITIQEADYLMRDSVCDNLRKEVNDFHEMLSDTEEWLLFLIAAPNSESKKRFPMTPSDVSRSRKRARFDTIVESVEEDEALPLPETGPVEPLRPVQRSSRTAFKLANLKMKEPNLTAKLRRPGNTIPEEDALNGSVTVVAPSKRARKGKTNMPKANMSSVTNESSFASARDSLASDICSNIKIEPMDSVDDIVLKKIESTEISSYNNCTKKSSLCVKSVTITRCSKRVTKQHVKTSVESPCRYVATENSTIEQNIDTLANDSDDDIPIINLLANTTKLEKTVLLTTTGRTEKSTSNAVIGKNMASLNSVDGREPKLILNRCSATSQGRENLSKNTELQQSVSNFSITATASDVGKSNTLVGIPPCKAASSADIAIVNDPIVREHAEKRVKSVRPNVLSNSTNRNTPEAIRNLVNRNLDPGSVKKRIEAIEQECCVNKEVAPAKPDVPIRMTRTKVREMMAALSAVTSVPDKKTARKIETSQLLKIARKSVMKAKKISLAKEHSKEDAVKSLEKENTSPPRNGTKFCLSQSIRSTNNRNKTPQNSYVHPSRLLAHMSTANQICTTGKMNRTTPNYVHPSRLLAQMSISKQPLVNFNTNVSTFLPKTRVVSTAEKAEEKRKEKRRQRRENNEDALLKKKALIEDRTEQQRKKREEKERNVLAQRALKERELAEMKLRIEKENEEKARLVQEREENLKKEILRKKEEAKQKAAKIEERRVRQEAERLQALKLQEEEQQKLLAQKKKEQEDAERLYAKRMLEEKERKEKEAALKEAALKLEKQNQVKKLVPTKPLDATFDVEKPVLVAASKYDFPLLDLSKGNDSDYSDAEEDVIPSWAKRESLAQTLKVTSTIPVKALLCYFGSKPTTPDLDEIFPNSRNKHVRSSSAFWKTPPRCSMVPHNF